MSCEVHSSEHERRSAINPWATLALKEQNTNSELIRLGSGASQAETNRATEKEMQREKVDTGDSKKPETLLQLLKGTTVQ